MKTTDNLFTENKKAKNGKTMKINEKQLRSIIKNALEESVMDPILGACRREISEYIQKLWTKYSPTVIADALSYVIEEVQAEANDYDQNVLQYPGQ